MAKLLEIKNQKNYLEYVYTNSLKSDIQIVVKKKVIKAHKEVLSLQSSVFLDKFLSEPELDKIEILDLDPEAVEIFINYLYTGSVLDENISEELFLVAHRYLEPNLKQVCRKRLGQTYTLKNATGRFLTFFKCEEKKLIKESSIFLAQNFNDAERNSDFDEVFKNEEAADIILRAFDDCKITILSVVGNPDRKKLIESAKTSDLTIRVKDQQFLGHKNILSARNTVFESIIAALPTTNNLSSSIDIPEVDSSTFEVFLKYIYTQDIDRKVISKNLMIVAHKYVDPELEKICEDQLLSKLCVANAISLLLLGTDLKSKKLEEEVSKFITEKFEEVKKQDAFQQIRENAVALDAIHNQFTNTLKFYEDKFSFTGQFYIGIPKTESDQTESETFYMGNLSWNILVQLQASKNISIFLCYIDAEHSFIAQHVKFSLKLVSNVNETYSTEITTTKRFCEDKTKPNCAKEWGFQFIPLAKLEDPSYGFLTNGKISVQVVAKVVK